MVFYSCDPGLVPERRMMSVCIGTGWSPNPVALSCSIGILQLRNMHGKLLCVFGRVIKDEKLEQEVGEAGATENDRQD